MHRDLPAGGAAEPGGVAGSEVCRRSSGGVGPVVNALDFVAISNLLVAISLKARPTIRIRNGRDNP